MKHWFSSDISMPLSYRIAIALMLVLLSFGNKGHAANVHERTLSDIQGIYGFSGNSLSLLEIRPEGSHYVVLLSGGSSETAEAGAPADCYIKAIGQLKEDVLLAVFQPFDTDTFSYSKVQANRENRKVTIIFGFGTAEVISADTFGYCGLGTSFLGKYYRK